ncbi:MAG: ABC transporter ATP-binding protein [Phototrophicaceae bacterium]
MSEMLLQVRNVTKTYQQRGTTDVVALQDFHMNIPKAPATITTIAGESGSGKTTLANLILGFEDLSSGQILFEGKDIANASPAEKKNYRREVQAVFQDPFSVYNPFYRIQHVFNMVIGNFDLADNKTMARDMIEDSLNKVGLYGEDVLRKYPHQLSGGQRQRIMMARAYITRPKLIVADEPVSMVDASLRASILDVMMRLRDDGISFIYVTHDLSTATQIGDQIFILYQGAIAETGDSLKVINEPQHPYVQLLVNSVPMPDPEIRWEGTIELPAEEEMRTSSKAGCRFYARCPHHMDKCLDAQPPLYQIDEIDHKAACFLHDEKIVALL